MSTFDCPIRLPGDGRHHWQAGPVLDSQVMARGLGSYVEAVAVLLVCECGRTRVVEPPREVTPKLAQEGS